MFKRNNFRPPAASFQLLSLTTNRLLLYPIIAFYRAHHDTVRTHVATLGSFAQVASPVRNHRAPSPPSRARNRALLPHDLLANPVLVISKGRNHCLRLRRSAHGSHTPPVRSLAQRPPPRDRVLEVQSSELPPQPPPIPFDWVERKANGPSVVQNETR